VAVDLHPDIVAAINEMAETKLGKKFGRWAKRNYGISGKKLMAKQTAGEFGGSSTATGRGKVSSAGARGPGQFIPSTRAAYIKQYGVDPWKSDKAAFKGMMIHDMGTGVAGYNPGMPTYTNYILGQKINPEDIQALRTGSAGGGGPRPQRPQVKSKMIPGQSFAPERAQARRALLLAPGGIDMQKLLAYKAQVGGLKDVPARQAPDDPGQLRDKNSPARADVRGILGPISKDHWKGARSAGARLAKSTGLPISSEKRSTVLTASGGVSDHYEGNKDSYAWDLSTSGDAGTKKARYIARRLGVKNWEGGSWLSVTKTINGRTYRFQVGWNVPDHYDHIHLGVDRVDTPG
jgi:hypothetical protein